MRPTCAQPSWSNVVSLATQQHCSRLNQNASMQTPSLRSNIQLVPMSITAAHTPEIIINNTVMSQSGHYVTLQQSLRCISRRHGQQLAQYYYFWHLFFFVLTVLFLPEITPVKVGSQRVFQ